MLSKLFGKKNMEILVEDLDEFFDKCLEELEEANDDLLKKYDIGSFERWDFDQRSAELVFSNKGVNLLKAKVSFIGSYSSKSESWMWGWGNDSLLPHLTEKTHVIREFGERNNIDVLVDRAWEATDDAGWAMAAASLKIVGGLGVYCGPGETSENYFLIHDLGKVQ